MSDFYNIRLRHKIGDEVHCRTSAGDDEYSGTICELMIKHTERNGYLYYRIRRSDTNRKVWLSGRRLITLECNYRKQHNL